LAAPDISSLSYRSFLLSQILLHVVITADTCGFLGTPAMVFWERIMNTTIVDILIVVVPLMYTSVLITGLAWVPAIRVSRSNGVAVLTLVTYGCNYQRSIMQCSFTAFLDPSALFC